MKKNLLAPAIPVSCLLLAVACLIVLCCAAAAQASGNSFRFVVMGDSRSVDCNYDTDPPDKCIDVKVLDQINKSIISLRPKPAFLIFNGDMARYGGTRMLDGWNKVMDTVRNAGIPVYAIIGNHELYDANGVSLKNQADFQTVFSGMPRNGPPGYESLAYSFIYGNSFFLILDTFYLDQAVSNWTDAPHIEPAQFDWADQQMAMANANPAVIHKFALSHAPAFSDEKTDYEQYRTDLWNRLNNNGFDVFFGAHEHLYGRFKVNGWTEPMNPSNPWLCNVFEVISGTAGAPLDEKSSNVADITLIQFNYTVVDVNGGTVSVNAYSYDNEILPIDSLTVLKEPLVVSKKGAGDGTVQSTQPYPYVDCGDTCTAYFNQNATVTLTAAPDANSVFKGWQGGACSGTRPCVIQMNSMKNVTASFAAKPLLTVHKLGYGDNWGTVVSRQGVISCGVTCSAQYADGAAVMLKASPAPGSTFSGWSGACAGTDEFCTVVMKENQSVLATFGSK
ncbi:MAG: metallophosphoesterase [Syntrophobacteraceae bacterium]